jgi:CRISPR/Cas system-associated exonuclease Cas4 (RecB family)
MCIQEEPREIITCSEDCPVSSEVKPHLSKSQLDKYLACPRSHHFNSTMKINPLRTAVNLLIGSATHHGIAAHYLAKKNNEEVNMTHAIDEIWSKEIADQTPAITKELMAARSASYDYIDLFLQNVSLDPVEVETRFEIPIINIDNGDTLPCTLVGIADLVDIPGNCPRPIEIKTRASKAPDYLPGLSLELTCYAYWIWHNGGHELVPVGYIHIIKTKAPYIQQQEGIRDIRDFIDLYNTAKAVYEAIGEGCFHKSPGMHCTWCDYFPICTRDHDLTKATFGNEAYQRLWEAEFI